MFLNIILVVLGLSILCFAFYGIYLYKRKRKRFEELKSIIEFVSFFLSALFAIITILQTSVAVQSSQEDSTQLFHKIDSVITSANNAKDVLDSVSQKLKPLPIQLDKFAESIAKLNSVIGVQQERFVGNINDLDQSVGTLTASLKDYRNYINDYSGQLKKIVTQTDSQLVIWKDQQELVKKEYNRRPVLVLAIEEKSETDSTVEIKRFVIRNNGNIKADVINVTIFLPEQYSVPLDNIGNWSFIRTISGFKQYQCDPAVGNSFPVTGGTGTMLRIGLKGYSKKKLQRMIGYSITYESKYIDGRVEGFIFLF